MHNQSHQAGRLIIWGIALTTLLMIVAQGLTVIEKSISLFSR